ncbi:MAG: tetratricopeptide repeat protein [Phycisphaerae bacterium]
MSRRDAESPRATFSGWGGPWPAVILGLLCSANSVFNTFTYDDNAIVRRNPRIQSLTNFHELWLTDWWYEHIDDEPILDPARDRLYRPLTLFSFALNYAVHEVRPLGYHVVNVLLHAGVCLLVWCFSRRLFDDAAIAAVAAILFAVHPAHSEAVAGIVGRGEVLAAGFMLLGLLALLPRAGPPGGSRTLLAAPAFLAAMLSKETAVCFPAVALLTLHAANRGRRLPRRWWLLHAAALVLPLAVYFPLRYYALEERLIRTALTSTLFNPLQAADLAGRLHGPFTILGHYACLLIVPSRLSCDYGLAVFNPGGGPELMTLLGALTAGGLVVALVGYRRTSPTWRRLAVLSAIFLASYALISNTLLLIGVSLAERLIYWPSVPLLLAVAVGVVGFWRTYCQPGRPLRQRAGLLRTFGVLLLLALGLRSVVRNSDWKNDERLFKTDLGISEDWQIPSNWRAERQSAHLCNSLARISISHAIDAVAAGNEAARAAWLDRAERLLNAALGIRQRYADALKNLGAVWLLRGQKEQALEYFEASLWLNPTDKSAQQHAGQLRGETQAHAARATELQREIERRPDDPDLRLRLSEVLIGLGRNYEALEQSEQAVRLAPDSVAALGAYGQALLLNLQQERALKVFQQVLEREPTDWQAHANVSKLLSERDPAAALHHARMAFDLQPNDLRTQINLATAYALNDQLEEALRRLRAIERNLPAADPRRRLVTDWIRELERRRR